jgi:hypothetical protein
MTFTSHNTANQAGVIPRSESRNATTSGTQAMRFMNDKVTAPFFVRPSFSIRAGALTHISDRLRLMIVVRMDTLCALAPAAMIDGDW